MYAPLYQQFGQRYTCPWGSPHSVSIGDASPTRNVDHIIVQYAGTNAKGLVLHPTVGRSSGTSRMSEDLRLLANTSDDSCFHGY